MNQPKPEGVYAVQVGSFRSFADAKAQGADYEMAQGCFDFDAGKGGHNLDIIIALEELISAINVGTDWEIVIVFDNGEEQNAYSYFSHGYISEATRLRSALKDLVDEIGCTSKPLRSLDISSVVLEHCKQLLNATQ